MKGKIYALLIGAIAFGGLVYGSSLSNAQGYQALDEEKPETTEISLLRLEAEEFSALQTDTVVSNGGKKAELCPVEGYKFYSLKVTLEDGSIQECELTNIFFTALIAFEWLDENRIVLEGHINPSLNVYIVYNLEENTFDEYNGLYFTWDNSYKNMYYVEKSPYWSEETVPERILDQAGRVYFETTNTQKLVNNLVLDADSEMIGFFVQEEKGINFEIMDFDTLDIIYLEKNVSYQNAKITVQ